MAQKLEDQIRRDGFYHEVGGDAYANDEETKIQMGIEEKCALGDPGCTKTAASMPTKQIMKIKVRFIKKFQIFLFLFNFHYVFKSLILPRLDMMIPG